MKINTQSLLTAANARQEALLKLEATFANLKSMSVHKLRLDRCAREIWDAYQALDAEAKAALPKELAIMLTYFQNSYDWRTWDSGTDRLVGIHGLAYLAEHGEPLTRPAVNGSIHYDPD